MTLAELHDVIDGYQERRDDYMEGVRLICWYTLKNPKAKMEKIWQLNRDVKARKTRLKNTKPIQRETE